MANLQLSLTTRWFDLTKAGLKPEDYREIAPYWINRLLKYDKDSITIEQVLCGLAALRDGYSGEDVCRDYGFSFKKFEYNIMTLGYPRLNDHGRILKLEHKGIEIREGNPEWGAEPGRLYFVIKHGEVLDNKTT